jgi:HEAT repeat protein
VARLEHEDRLQTMLVRLKAPDRGPILTGDRAQAADALGRLHDPRAVEPLLAALKDPNPLTYADEALRIRITVRGEGEPRAYWGSS